MIKKIITIGTITASCAGALVGCSGEYQNLVNQHTYSEYVDLAEYKGIEVTKVDRSNETVSDEDVQQTLDYLKESLKEYEEKEIVETGDTVTINATGTINGEAIENGTLEDYDYEVGSGMLIEGFDDQLVGKKANEEFEVKAKFPDDYGDETLNGKEAIFKTTITKISRAKETELNDDWVKANKEKLKQQGYEGETLDELKTSIRSNTVASLKEGNDQKIASEALDTIIEKSTFKSYPEEETNTYKENIKTNIKKEFESYGSEYDSFDTYLTEVYELENEEALETYATEQAQDYMKTKMVVTLIAEENGIVVSDEEVEKMGKQMASYYGYENFEKMKEEYGDTVKEDFAFQTLWDKVSAYLASVSNPVKEAEDDTVDEIIEEITKETNVDNEVIEGNEQPTDEVIEEKGSEQPTENNEETAIKEDASETTE